MRRFLIWVLAIGFLGWAALMFVQWQLKIGPFAANPQRLELPLGATRIAGGGRAVLSFIADDDGKAKLEVKCAAEEVEVELGQGEASAEICGIVARLLELRRRLDIAGPKETIVREAIVEVSWEP